MLADTRDGNTMIAGRIMTEPRYTVSANKGTPICSFAVRAAGRDAPLTTVKAFNELAMVMSTANKGDACFAVGRKSINEYGGKTYTEYLADFVSIASAQAAANAVMPTAPAQPTQTGFADSEEVTGDDLPF